MHVLLLLSYLWGNGNVRSLRKRHFRVDLSSQHTHITHLYYTRIQLYTYTKRNTHSHSIHLACTSYLKTDQSQKPQKLTSQQQVLSTVGHEPSIIALKHNHLFSLAVETDGRKSGWPLHLARSMAGYGTDFSLPQLSPPPTPFLRSFSYHLSASRFAECIHYHMANIISVDIQKSCLIDPKRNNTSATQ